MTGFSRDTNPVGRVWAYVEGSLENTTGLVTGFVRSHTNSLTEGAHIRGVLIFRNGSGQNIYVACPLLAFPKIAKIFGAKSFKSAKRFNIELPFLIKLVEEYR
jgi:hypothetical protein